MHSISAADAKNRFGQLLDTAQREPVRIEKHGRPIAVVLSAEAYEELQDLKLERLRAEIRAGLEDIAAGRTVDADEAFGRVLDRLG